MRYYQPELKTEIDETNALFNKETAIEETDERVKDFFKPLPKGYRVRYENNLPIIEPIPKPTDAEIFEISKNSKINELKQAYNEANHLDIAYMNTTFQADKESQSLIVSVLSAGSVPTGFYWVDSLNNQVTMTHEELQGLSAEILARGQTNFAKYQDLKAQVNTATTQADLDAIVW